MKLYIAGPMLDECMHNHQTFFRVAIQLRDMGHTVVNPAEYDVARGFMSHLPADDPRQPGTRSECLRRDFRFVLDCDGIVLLPGWEQSEGACAERLVAQLSGRKVFYYGEEYGTAELSLVEPSDYTLEWRYSA